MCNSNEPPHTFSAYIAQTEPNCLSRPVPSDAVTVSAQCQRKLLGGCQPTHSINVICPLSTLLDRCNFDHFLHTNKRYSASTQLIFEFFCLKLRHFLRARMVMTPPLIGWNLTTGWLSRESEPCNYSQLGKTIVWNNYSHLKLILPNIVGICQFAI